MIEVSSELEGKTFSLWDLEQKLKPLGYVIGGNWDYDHGSFDYLINNKDGYQFLRLPFQAVDGTLDRDGTKVKLLRPYLLAHQYEGNLDNEGNIGNFSASFNQFAAPEDSDADFPEKYISYGKSLVQDVEKALL
ncbi:YugN-like family protein [Peribacillus asahii]|uniref:YugN-like family protein n=1 Tax=Peribacillus asahii TaxID=228899 RepID=UPI00207AAC48|nr:YugN-like family protein [Peribacillus asahii]USK69738.1 YugN-like family protein [Peribacillus asahii]